MKNPVYDKKTSEWDRSLAGGSHLDNSMSTVVGKYKAKFWVQNREFEGEEPRDKYPDLGFRIARNK